MPYRFLHKLAACTFSLSDVIKAKTVEGRGERCVLS